MTARRVSPVVLYACAVTWSISSGDLCAELANDVKKKCVTPFPVIPLSLPRSDLIKEQRADPTLEELRDKTVSVEQFGDVAHGYFLQDDVLMRKWVSHSSSFVGEAVSLDVVPVKL